MGLDMYLNARKYLSQYKPELKEKIDTLRIMFPDTKEYPINGITMEVGYWRKANHIHGWFVEHIQEGNDNCGSYWVQREQLLELKAVCEEVLKHKEDKVYGKNVLDLLPKQEGFFFGGTEIDESYFEDCQETIRIIDEALKLDDSWDFEYHSSW